MKFIFSYYFLDNVGTVRSIAEQQSGGIVVHNYSYSAFGELLGGKNEAEYSRILYIGKELDRESGEYALGIRLYNAGTGLFTSGDPLWGAQLGNSAYHYGYNSPLLFSDPTGLLAGQRVPLFSSEPDKDGFRGYWRGRNYMARVHGDDAYDNYIDDVARRTKAIANNIGRGTGGGGGNGGSEKGIVQVVIGWVTDFATNIVNWFVAPFERAIAKLQDDAINTWNGIVKHLPGELGNVLRVEKNGGRMGAAKSAGRVFWSSGGNPAVETAAREFAIRNGMTTLEMTKAGQEMIKLTEGMPWEKAGPMWKRISMHFAQGAEDTVHVFHNAGGIGANSVWGTVEYPILQQNGVHIIYHLVP